MSRVEKMITELTRQTFMLEQEQEGKHARRQISLRPSAVVLCQIDTLADILDQSRQQLMDELLEGAMHDAVEAYANAHGPDHSEKARRGFVDAFKKRWDEIYSEGDK
ncbi:hypothetical protein [Crocosphaera watsonii]|nr:hypothetical protein [Crocosphaera watsonii]